MAWVTTASATPPSQITAAGTTEAAPEGAINVPMSVAMVAVCNPAAYVLNSKEVTQPGQNGEDIPITEYFLTPAPLTLQRAQTIQKALVNASCVSAMTGGFQSSALGAAYTYPSTLTDQHNLSGSVVASLLPNLPSTWTTPFWCQDSAGTWAMVQHTAAQIQQVGLDEKAWIVSCQVKLAGLNAQIAAAQTVSGVQAITFS